MRTIEKIKTLEDACKNPRSYAHQIALNLRLMCAVFEIFMMPFFIVILCVTVFKILNNFFYDSETVFIIMSAIFLPIAFLAMSYLDYKHNKTAQ